MISHTFGIALSTIYHSFYPLRINITACQCSFYALVFSFQLTNYFFDWFLIDSSPRSNLLGSISLHR